MSFPRDDRRTIRVDGVDYCWTVSPDSGFLTLIVQSAAGEGQRVEAQFTYEDPPLTPAIARRVIEEALRRGWDRQAQGPPMVLRYAVSASSSSSS